MWNFKRAIKYGVVRESRNVHFWKSYQMCTVKRMMKYALLKELSNTEF